VDGEIVVVVVVVGVTRTPQVPDISYFTRAY
jgi:hypothetical protein